MFSMVFAPINYVGRTDLPGLEEARRATESVLELGRPFML